PAAVVTPRYGKCRAWQDCPRRPLPVADPGRTTRTPVTGRTECRPDCAPHRVATGARSYESPLLLPWLRRRCRGPRGMRERRLNSVERGVVHGGIHEPSLERARWRKHTVLEQRVEERGIAPALCRLHVLVAPHILLAEEHAEQIPRV